ncbi:hypothetical protein [Halorussus sp. JP-T4]|nr:hypothetical protein [Halorussus sp. JP-T4]NHN60217.1 hypothetical protein [Halorussus sp. JP-T4]
MAQNALAGVSQGQGDVENLIVLNLLFKLGDPELGKAVHRMDSNLSTVPASLTDVERPWRRHHE